MGTWGTKIFSDDFALDIKGEYNFLLTQFNDEEAEKKIFDIFYNDCKDTEEEPIFWFSLSLVQWQKGRLTENVKQRAIAFIDSGKDLERWNESKDPKNVQKRKDELDKLKATLASEQPIRKTIRKPSPLRSPWDVGDLLAHKIVDTKVIEYTGIDCLNKYVLLRVLKIERHMVSQYFSIDDLYREMVLMGLYGWIGDSMPHKSIVGHLHYIPIHSFRDVKQTYFRLSWLNNNELKRAEMSLLDNDGSYKMNTPDYFSNCGPVEVSMFDLDIRISEALQSAGLL